MKYFHLFVCLWVVLAGSRVEAADVAPSADEIRPILIGSEVPKVTVRTIEGESIGLREAIAGKPTVLLIYRGGWCPICNLQLAALGPVQERLRDLGVQMIGISADAPERLRPSLEKHGLGFTLLSDFDLNAAKAFGIAFHVSDEYVDKLEKYGLDIEGNSLSSVQVLPVPAVFVVRPDGIITFSYVNPNYKVRCDPDVLLAAAAAVVKKP